MIRRFIHNILTVVFASALLAACNVDETWSDSQESDAPEGYVTLHFGTDLPEMERVVTRSVDSDGGGVQNMTLFCFDSHGLFITTVPAALTPTDYTSGKLTATVPEYTRIIHFVANENLSNYMEDKFRAKSESEVMAQMEATEGMMIYWARFACSENNEATIDKQLPATITLLRNHALIELGNLTYSENGTSKFTVTGFAVYNTNAYGTVAPYHPSKGFAFDFENDDFVTLPQNIEKLSGIKDVTDQTHIYVYESENQADDPVSVIVRGYAYNADGSAGDELYYRIMLMQGSKQLLIRRNHRYTINITGVLQYGEPTFAAAVEGAATNNIWISISDDVKEVEDNQYVLSVDRTSYVFSANQTGTAQEIYYTLKSKNGNLVASDAPDVDWVDNNVASTRITHEFDPATGRGTITIYPVLLGNSIKHEGTLLIKMPEKAGASEQSLLQRKVKIVAIADMSFEPAWVTAQVNPTITTNNNVDGGHVTVMFTVPENCPDVLYPMTVLISANSLDVRSASGMILPLIYEGEPGYGDENLQEWGYKYVHTVYAPGVQRLYFYNTKQRAEGEKATIYVESSHFETLAKNVTFSSNNNVIQVDGLSHYDHGNISGGTANDEPIYYRLVPKKRYAKIGLDMVLKRITETDVDEDGNFEETLESINAASHDEFLLFSQFLKPVGPDEAVTDPSPYSQTVTFYPEESETYYTNHASDPIHAAGRFLMFKPTNVNADVTGKYPLCLYTTVPVSDEPVRISTSANTYPAVLAEDNGPNGLYAGEPYRSIVFEVSTYNAFRFSARVNGAGAAQDVVTTNETTIANVPDNSDAVEKDTPLEWSYKPGFEVDIEIDITSFKGTDNQSVDPFGESFEIYIDAPMLSIDTDRLAECRLNEEKLRKEGNRFVYTVEADRAGERKYGCPGLTVMKTDGMGVEQGGERKRLPFRCNTIVSAGDIVISSDKEKVVFFDKTFTITNTPITGELKYRTADGTEAYVPSTAFVAFEHTAGDATTRIGTVHLSEVTAGGVKSTEYELNLRKEYSFGWSGNEKVAMIYTVTTGDDKVEYRYEASNLAELYDDDGVTDIVLVEQQKADSGTN